MNKYQIIGACGEGFYGTVFKCKHRASDTVVAIKQFKAKEDYATKREIAALQKLKHQNIINLRELFREQGKLHMVFEFLDTDLLNALEKYPKGMPEKLVRIYMNQLCKALEYCHQRNVVHRDLKPENLLVCGNVANPHPKHSLKLCDFGEARDIGPSDKLLSGIIGTRWYRAPEILIGAKLATASQANDASSFNKVTRPKLLKYDFLVDMWGVGCIMGEIILASPMFPADTDLQQLEMVQVYGTTAQLSKRFAGKCSPTCASAIKGLLELSPHKRLSALNALQHQFFAGGRKNKLVDSFTANTNSHRNRMKFQPQFNHGLGVGSMDEVDEEILTESDDDNSDEGLDDIPEFDDFDEAEEEYDKYEEPPLPRLDPALADSKKNDKNDESDGSYSDGYSEDEFEVDYSEDGFDEHSAEEDDSKIIANHKHTDGQKRKKINGKNGIEHKNEKKGVHNEGSIVKEKTMPRGVSQSIKRTNNKYKSTSAVKQNRSSKYKASSTDAVKQQNQTSRGQKKQKRKNVKKTEETKRNNNSKRRNPKQELSKAPMGSKGAEESKTRNLGLSKKTVGRSRQKISKDEDVRPKKKMLKNKSKDTHVGSGKKRSARVK